MQLELLLKRQLIIILRKLLIRESMQFNNKAFQFSAYFTSLLGLTLRNSLQSLCLIRVIISIYVKTTGKSTKTVTWQLLLS